MLTGVPGGTGSSTPPVGFVAKVLRYAEFCGAKGLLVVPEWPASVFMARLRGAGGQGDQSAEVQAGVGDSSLDEVQCVQRDTEV